MSWLINKTATKLPWWDRNLTRRTVGKVGRAARVIIHNPHYRIMAALLLAVIFVHRQWFAIFAFSAATALLVAWMWRNPRGIEQSMHGWWRSNRQYRWSWTRALRRCGAFKIDTPVPLLISTHSTRYVDKLRVYVPTGLDPTSFQDVRAELLKWGWRALSCRVFNPEPKTKTIELWNLINDPLTDTIEPLSKPKGLLPKEGYKLALIEDGEPWHFKLLGRPANTYVCGVTGSGKGSFIGSLLDQLQFDVAEGTVETWGIDKQASELGMWRASFKKLAYSQEEAVVMLEELVAIMNARTRKMFGITRQHKPSKGDPFYVLVIDEGLDLLDKTNKELYRRAVTALSELLRKDRKASIAVFFFAQRAEIEFVEIRKLFSIFVALQLATDVDVDMVLGRGALAAGANPHEFDLPGYLFVRDEMGMMRGRLPYYDDDYPDTVLKAPGNDDPANLPQPPDDKFGGVLIA